MVRQATIFQFITGTVSMEELLLYCIADQEQRLVLLSFSENRYQKAKTKLLAQIPGLVFAADKCFLKQLHSALKQYLDGREHQLRMQSAPLLLEWGTELQKRIWQQISRIGNGKTKTYGELAQDLGNPKLARVVGQACNANPLALIIPCHRVVGANSLGGYAGGGLLKSRLLRDEKGLSPSAFEGGYQVLH